MIFIIDSTNGFIKLIPQNVPQIVARYPQFDLTRLNTAIARIKKRVI